MPASSRFERQNMDNFDIAFLVILFQSVHETEAEVRMNSSEGYIVLGLPTPQCGSYSYVSIQMCILDIKTCLPLLPSYSDKPLDRLTAAFKSENFPHKSNYLLVQQRGLFARRITPRENCQLTTTGGPKERSNSAT